MDDLLKRLGLLSVLVLLPLVASACYKDAGDDLEPTSRQEVNLTDIAPTTPAPPTSTPTPLPTAQAAATDVPPAITATRTLVPTTTPADIVAVPPTAAPTEAPDTAGNDGLDPTPQQQVPPGMTLEPGTPTPTEVLITTPGMSDILPTETPVPTRDPAATSAGGTPTAIPIEENPCVHVVQPNDTLYSIAQDNGVLLYDLVAANPQYLGGSADTPLQIGWELNIPDCETETEAETVTEPEGDNTETTSTGSETQDGQVIHTVQPGEGIYAIARQYGVTPEQIIAANGLANPNLIYPGDQLIIPVGE
jgi:LysM repeat protein